MKDYAQRQAAKRASRAARAAQIRARGLALCDRARDMASVIPMGQPILVGHYSEGRDRRYRARIDQTMRRGLRMVELSEKYAVQAATESTAISADDPEAIERLRAKIDKAKADQAAMKAANAAIRKGRLEATGIASAAIACHTGFPSYILTNNNANIKRMEARLAELIRAEHRETRETAYAGFTVREDTDENRIMFIFDAVPDQATRDMLKRHAFKWSPTRGAWVRQWTGNAVYAAREIIRALTLATD